MSSQVLSPLIYSTVTGWNNITNVIVSVLIILRKEVIQPQVPLRLPCYDLVPIAELTLGICLYC